MDNRELRLAATMVELAEAFDTEQGEDEYARRLTACLAELLAPAETGLFIADDSGRLIAAAASSERVSDLISREARSGEGPSAACYPAALSVLNQSIPAAGARWPSFAAAAGAAGFGMVSTIPVRRGDQAIGVISVFRAGDHRLTDTEIRLARILAEAAAIAISQQREHRDSKRVARQLQQALDSRVCIEQAKGAVAARLGITPDEAFELLRGYARRTSSRLADVAGQAIRGELAARDLAVPRETGRSRVASR